MQVRRNTVRGSLSIAFCLAAMVAYAGCGGAVSSNGACTTCPAGTIEGGNGAGGNGGNGSGSSNGGGTGTMPPSCAPNCPGGNPAPTSGPARVIAYVNCLCGFGVGTNDG